MQVCLCCRRLFYEKKMRGLLYAAGRDGLCFGESLCYTGDKWKREELLMQEHFG